MESPLSLYTAETTDLSMLTQAADLVLNPPPWFDDGYEKEEERLDKLASSYDEKEAFSLPSLEEKVKLLNKIILKNGSSVTSFLSMISMIPTAELFYSEMSLSPVDMIVNEGNINLFHLLITFGGHGVIPDVVTTIHRTPVSDMYIVAGLLKRVITTTTDKQMMVIFIGYLLNCVKTEKQFNDLIKERDYKYFFSRFTANSFSRNAYFVQNWHCQWLNYIAVTGNKLHGLKVKLVSSPPLLKF